MVFHTRTGRIGATLASLTAAGLLAACAPGMNGSAASNTVQAGSVSTDPAKMGNVTLQVLDTFTGGTDNTWMTALVSAFEQKYPNITIQRTSLPWSDAMSALPLKLKSANPPDIVPPNNGWQSLGTLVRGGLVLNLDNYADAYGWKTAFPQPILRQSQFSTDGKQMGTGSLFGAPVARASIIEVYYNRSLLQRIGSAVPTTLADFESDLAKAKAAGITPIALGNVDQQGVTEPLFSLMNSIAAQNQISDFVYSQNNVGVDQTGLSQAVTTLKQWADQGYLTANFAGIAGQDAAQSFVDGKALFRFDYSGSLPLASGQDKEFGSFLLPRQDGGTSLATAASAANLSVSAKSQHPDAAAAFLNFAAGEQAAQLAVQNNTMPLLHPDVQTPGDNPLFSDDVAISQQISTHGSAVPYLDWTTPTLLDTINTSMQNLLAGKATPADVVAGAAKDDTDFVKTLTR